MYTVVTPIPKLGTPKKKYEKLAPLMFFVNVIYKLPSDSIAKHMKTVLDELINKDQTWFIKG